MWSSGRRGWYIQYGEERFSLILWFTEWCRASVDATWRFFGWN